MNTDCSIFIPLYNEEEIVETNTLALMAYLGEKGIRGEIILGSNGSTDKTPDIIRELAHRHDAVKSFHLPEKGPGKAFIRGVETASNEFVISQDADLAVELDFIPLALDFLTKCDMVMGCKRMRIQNRSWVRSLGSNFFIFAAATVLGAAGADFSIGAKAYRRSFVLEHADHLDHWTAYVLELFYHAIEEKRRVVEIPVECTDTRKSHFRLSSEAFYKFKHLFIFARHEKNRHNI
jgi:glycosyltransferase involved in cell wall biosynthesis